MRSRSPTAARTGRSRSRSRRRPPAADALHSGHPGVARTRAPSGPPDGAAPAPSSSRRQIRPVFDTLSDRLRMTLATLTGRGRISEADVDVAMREIRLSLLEADVNFRVVKDFVARVREQAIGADILGSLTAGQQVVKIVHDELVALLGVGGPVPPRGRGPARDTRTRARHPGPPRPDRNVGGRYRSRRH